MAHAHLILVPEDEPRLHQDKGYFENRPEVLQNWGMAFKMNCLLREIGA
jgi:hypothetical protein